MEYEMHSVVNIFPEMSEDDFKELVEDIRTNGQLETIKIHGDKIIDGRHRYLACKELGIEPKVEEVDPDSPTDYVLSANLYRRHLTTGQRAMAGLEAERTFADEAKKRRKQTKMDKTGSVGSGTRPDHPARTVAAKAVRVSADAIAKAKALAKRAPDLADAVRIGKLDLTPAYNALLARERAVRLEQEKAARAAKAKKAEDELAAAGFRRDSDPEFLKAQHQKRQLALALEIRKGLSALLVKISGLAEGAAELEVSEAEHELFTSRIAQAQARLGLLKEIIDGSRGFDDEVRALLES